MARALTAPEIATLRTDGQFSQLYLGVAKYNTIYTARLASLPVGFLSTSTDMVTEIVTTGGSGTLANVKAGMTLYIGTTAGAYDVGMCRIRVAPSTTTWKVGECSEVDFSVTVAGGLYLTITDDFGLWAKPIKITAETPYMDVDVAYSDQHHDFDPVPVLGSHAVGWLAPAALTSAIAYTSASINYTGGSWINDGGYQKRSNGTGDKAALSFTGNRVRYYGEMNDFWYGYVNVYIDSVLMDTIDCGAGPNGANTLFYDSGALTEGAHTIWIEVDGTTHTHGTYISIQQFVVNYIGQQFVTTFDASESWVIDSSISTYDWTCAGATFDNHNSATPTLTFYTAGTFPVYCTVTAANGKSTEGVRYALIYDDAHPPITAFQLESCSANYDGGGWAFDVSLWDEVAQADVRDRALCILFARDFYNGVETTCPAPIVGRENIICTGWIAEETITRHPMFGVVGFGVRGADYWLKQMVGFPSGLEFVTGTPAAWTSMKLLTVDKYVWHFLHWRTTATATMDIFLSGDTRYVSKLNSLSNNLWTQLLENVSSTIFGTMGVDRFGRFFFEIEPLMELPADRTWPVVMDLTEQDWRGEIEYQRITTPPVSQVNLSGIALDASKKATAFFSLSYGHVFGRNGDTFTEDKLLVGDQATSNNLAGLYAGWKNNHVPPFIVNLASNFRAADLWPRQKIGIIVPADDPRTVGISGDCVPRAIEFSTDPNTGFMNTSITLEKETDPEIAVNGDIPDRPGDFTIPPFDPPPPPPIVVTPFDIPKIVLMKDTTAGLIYTENFDAVAPDLVQWQFVNDGLDAAHQAAIDKIFVTLTGKVYIGYVNDSSFKEIWYAGAPGGTFTKLIDTNTLMAHYGTAQATLSTMGINPLASDQIAFIANNGGGPAWNPVAPTHFNMFVGNSGGFVAGADMSNVSSAHGGWTLTFGAGRWRYTGWATGLFAVTWLFTFDPSGGDQTNIDIATAPNIIGVNGWGVNHVGAGATDKIYILDAFGGEMWNIQGNGAAINNMGVESPYASVWHFATDPTSATICANFHVTTVPEVKISTDSGANWTNITTLDASAVWAFGWALTDTLRWVAARDVVGYTNDAWATVIDRTGNLLDILPNPHIQFIKVIA